jgi:tRNA-2-methylthio-N6-dimethylallyladenosine synthase
MILSAQGKAKNYLNQNLRTAIAQNGLTYHIETYGCQMNAHESEKAAGVLEALGYSAAQEKKGADLILFNTCCVREHAEARLSGNVGALKEYKKARPGALLAVWGCMMQQPGAAQRLAARFPFVDIVFGTNQLHHIEQMLSSALLEGKRVVMAEPDEAVIEGLPAQRSGASAFVNIIYGCNNFCTYCIVPYVRGRERSRKSTDILNEIDTLCQSGVTEVTLLGQNVNSYGKDLGRDLSFPELIRSIDKNTGVKRLRFMTSHPKDLTDELIDCYGSVKCLCEHIHLPVQAGSSQILAAMNRRYTRDQYLVLVSKLRARVPGIGITTDFIVGFPGETEEDFKETLSLVRDARFDAAYTFAYSRRTLTKAASMPGQLSRAEKSERLSRLNALVLQYVRESSERYAGSTVEVLAESRSRMNGDELSGRTRTAKMVSFPGHEDEIGEYLDVDIDRISGHTLHGLRKS